MTEEKKYKNLLSLFGIAATIGWFWVFCHFSELDLSQIVRRFKWLPLNEKGDFLAGLFAPIAVLWLIIGYFLQMKQFSSQQKQINMQTFLMLEKTLVDRLKWSMKAFIIYFDYSNIVTEDNPLSRPLDEYKVRKEEALKNNNLFSIIAYIKEILEYKDFGSNDMFSDGEEQTKIHTHFYDVYKNHKNKNDKLTSQAIDSYFNTFEILRNEAEKVDNRIHDFHKNSPAGELYDLFKKIIDAVEKHNAAQAAQENNPS
jgi:hypothetical protein